VKVTLVPEHIGFAEGEIVIAGVKFGFTVIVTALLVAVAGEGQVALLVITTVTTSLLASEEDA
jgi:hypothetical protein